MMGDISTQPGSQLQVSVIIPTTCERKRKALIDRAVRSVLNQAEVTLELVVVVNGDRYDPDLLEMLRADRRLRVVQLEEGNVSLARFHGIRVTTGEFFCFLDDDDELLPGGLRSRVDAFQATHPDVVVTNGLVFEVEDRLLVDESLAAHIRSDPVMSFLSQNWFASPAALFRRSSVGAAIFNFRHKYFEWTYLFFRLITAGKRVQYSDAITYRKFENIGDSVSKSDAYRLSSPAFLEDLLEMPLENRIRRAIREKLCVALNGVSNYYLDRNNLRTAWGFHLRCLANGGWQFVLYSRQLLLASIRRIV